MFDFSKDEFYGAHYKPLKDRLTHPTTCHVCVDIRFTWYQVPESMLHREIEAINHQTFDKASK